MASLSTEHLTYLATVLLAYRILQDTVMPKRIMGRGMSCGLLLG